MTMPEQGGFGGDIGGPVDASFDVPNVPTMDPVDHVHVADGGQEQLASPVRTVAQKLLWASVLSNALRRVGFGESEVTSPENPNQAN